LNVKWLIERNLDIINKRLLDIVKNIDSEQFLWKPTTQSNSIGFILWHIFRVEDNYIQKYIMKRDELWKRNNLYIKYNLPERDTGFEYTPKQVADLEVPALEDLLAYQVDVRLETLDYLRSISLEDLKFIPRPKLRPNYSVIRIFQQIMIHESEHLGQIDMLLGLKQGKYVAL